jgi:hypothetical protein
VAPSETPNIGSGTSDDERATGGSSGSSTAGAKHQAVNSTTLQLQSLRAVPTRIHHDWREGVRHSEPGQGSPPYCSQVGKSVRTEMVMLLPEHDLVCCRTQDLPGSAVC